MFDSFDCWIVQLSSKHPGKRGVDPEKIEAVGHPDNVCWFLNPTNYIEFLYLMCKI